MTISRNEGEKTKHQVNSTNNKGYTPLHYACWQGHQIVAKELKKAEADPSARYGGCESNLLLLQCKKQSLFFSKMLASYSAWHMYVRTLNGMYESPFCEKKKLSDTVMCHGQAFLRDVSNHKQWLCEHYQCCLCCILVVGVEFGVLQVVLVVTTSLFYLVTRMM